MRLLRKAKWHHFLTLFREKHKRRSLVSRLWRQLYLNCSQFISRRFSGYALHPVELNLEISNRCNLRCRMCPREIMIQARPGLLQTEKIRPIIDQLRVRKLRFSGLGEPMLAANFWELTELGCRIAMVTNGTLLKKSAVEKLCDGRAEMITISMDAAAPETYRKIRRADCFEKLYLAITQIDRIRGGRGQPFPLIAINWVVMKSNYREIHQLVERLTADKIKVDLIHCDPLVSYTDEMFKEVLLPGAPGLYDLLNRARVKAKAGGIYLEFPYYEIHHSANDDNHPNVMPSCGVLWESIFVTGEGEYMPCCEYVSNPMANVDEIKPMVVWNSEKLRSARLRALQGLAPFEYCIHCHKFSGYGDPLLKIQRAEQEV